MCAGNHVCRKSSVQEIKCAGNHVCRKLCVQEIMCSKNVGSKIVARKLSQEICYMSTLKYEM